VGLHLRRTDRQIALWLIAAMLAAILAVAAACAGDDDDDDGDDDDDADDPPAEQPTGACACCYEAEGELWGWCWSVGFETECQTGCEQIYGESALAGHLFFPDETCLEVDETASCRASF